MKWFRSWWKNTSNTLKIGLIIVLLVVVVLFIGGYFLNWDWTGFGPYTAPTKDSTFQRGKTLWDWLQLFFIPAAIAFGVWWLTRLQQQRDQQLADQRAQADHDAAENRAQADRLAVLDNQRESALKEYIDNMSELLLEKSLLNTLPDSEPRIVARVLTLTVLHRLDNSRKRNVLEFLQESGLIEVGKRIVDLGGADLSGAYLVGADLVAADLTDVNLTNADLSKAALSRADLTNADLSRANLSGAILSRTIIIHTNFCEANLHEAILSPSILNAEQLEERLSIVESLKGATMPDGTKHD